MICAAILILVAVTGRAAEPVASALMGVLVAILASGLFLAARQVRRGARGARAPILVWQLLQATVGVPTVLAGGTGSWVGGALVLASALGVIAVLWPGALDGAAD